MPRSLVNGDYSLVIAIESASRANSWYRVLADRHTGNLSCDCPAWTFRQDGGLARSCKHTRLAQQLMGTQQPGSQVARASGPAAEANQLIQATRQQWPGLGGRWGIEQRTHTFDNTPYSFVLLRLTTGNGTRATLSSHAGEYGRGRCRLGRLYNSCRGCQASRLPNGRPTT
jgi:hypothetical protein